MTNTHNEADIAYLPATEQLRLFRARELSPVEVLQAQVARADALAESVNALTWRFTEEAMQQATAAERRYLGRGEAPRALEGITLAMKEEMPVAGQPNTSASLIYADEIADHTSPMAQRLLDAGVIIHARSTQPEFACATLTQSHLFGVTRNPWNLNFDVGGSSGGAGAALAAGLTTLATGSDIAGSIRIPSACCGVVGFKPPYGRVPQSPPFNLDHYCHDGPMARTVGDCAIFENAISGVWPGDIASLRERVEIPSALPGIEGLRIALSVDLGDWDPNADVRANTLRAADALRAAGATVEEVDFRVDKAKLFEAAKTHYASIFGPYVGGLIADHRDKMTSYAIDFGMVCGEVARGEFLAGLEFEGELTASLGALLEDFDALICPTLTIAALPVDTPWSPATPATNLHDVPLDHVMTMPFNVASRCPVLNVPSGFSGDGVPTGLQLVGRSFDDVTPFRLGAALERAGLWDYATIRPALSI